MGAEESAEAGSRVEWYDRLDEEEDARRVYLEQRYDAAWRAAQHGDESGVRAFLCDDCAAYTPGRPTEWQMKARSRCGTLLGVAALNDHVSVVRLLVHAASAHEGMRDLFPDVWYREALHYAVRNSSGDVLTVLCASPNTNVADSLTGRSTGIVYCIYPPLHCAARHDRVDALRLLLHFKASVNLRNVLMDTPAHMAVAGECVDALRVLLEAKADMQAVSDRVRGVPLTPLQIAAESSCPPVLELLGEAGFTVPPRSAALQRCVANCWTNGTVDRRTSSE